MKQLNPEDDEDQEYEYPPVTATGLYAIHSIINHSCEPNAEAFKREQDEDSNAVILVKKPIKKGDEVVLAYVDEELPLKDRKKLLYYPYLFECDCRKCTRDQNKNEKRRK
jgi:SET domain-containing protein